MADWLRRLRTVLLISVFFAVFLYILSLNFRAADRMDLLQRIVIESVLPVFKSFGNITAFAEDIIKEYVLLRQLRSENQNLRERVAALEQKIIDYQEASVENLRLRRLLDFRSTLQAETIPAQVVLHDLTGWFQTLMVDKGFRDQIAPDMAVVNDEGIVGRILDVSDRYARVLLITDPGSSIDAIIQRNRVRGVLSGRDANTCTLKYVRGNLEVQVGDLVVTSGKDGVFPKGLRLGTVQGVSKDPLDLFQRIEVKPLVRLSTIEELLIIKRDVTPSDKLVGTDSRSEQ
jgi:rod shape-determining protein MreC